MPAKRNQGNQEKHSKENIIKNARNHSKRKENKIKNAKNHSKKKKKKVKCSNQRHNN